MRTNRVPIVFTTLLMLLVAACGGGGPTDPTEAVVDAFDRTFSGPFAFDVSVELDEAARDALAQEDPQASLVIDGMALSGAVGDPAFSLLVEFMGIEAFEMRRTDQTHTYLRLAISEVAQAFGEPIPQDEMLAGLAMLPPELQDAARAFLEGRWVAFIGDPEAVATPSELSFGPDPEEIRSDFEAAFGDPGEFMRRFTEIEESGTQGSGTVYTVRIRARDLARAGMEFFSDAFGGIGMMMGSASEDIEADLAEVPELIDGGQVVVENRLVQQLSVDVLAMARSAAGDDAADVPPGSASLVVDLSDHGTEPDLATPEGAVELDLEQLADLFMQGFMMGGGFGEMESGSETVTLEPSFAPSEG